MITKEEALKIAKQIIPKVNKVKDDPKAYIFTNSNATGDEVWDNEVVVLKQTGKVVSYMDYIMNIK